MKHSTLYAILTIFACGFFISQVATAQPAYSTEGYTSISGSNQSLTANNSNNEFLIPADQSWSGSITFNGNGTLYLIIEGTADFSWTNMGNGNLEIIVGTNGAIAINGFNVINYLAGKYKLTNYAGSLQMSSIRGNLQNYGTITGNPNLQIGNDEGATLDNYGTVNAAFLQIDKVLTNYGSINLTGRLDVNSSASFENKSNATVSVNGDFKVDKIFRNFGETTISGNLNVNSSATLENSCKIEVGGNLKNDKNIIMREGSYLEVTGRSTFNSNASTTMEANAFLKTMDITNWSAPVTGPAAGNALVQYFGTFTGSTTNFSGSVYLIDSAGKMGETLVNFTIAANGCTPGYGTVQDDDGDGIANDIDDFPNDGDRAFISYYPAEGSWHTLMFEDQWPNLGDYDFNDLVIKYRYEFISNANNEVLDMMAHFQVVAAGASYANGFGFKLGIPNTSVQSVTGCVYSGTPALNTNGTEQTSGNETVIIVYNNLKASLGSMFNVERGGTTVDVEPITVHISLANVNPGELSDINPFLYVSQTRGREIHLMGSTPTSKADNSYFGTADDNSDNGTTYRSTQGFPWCLDIPEDVSHMLETLDFTTGYPDFINWAESGGTQNQDWYNTNKKTSLLY